MEWVRRFVLILLLKLVSPATITTSSSSSPSAQYSVTENIIDIPDNRTHRPIVTNFTFTTPLNYGNNTLLNNNNLSSNNTNTIDVGDEHNTNGAVENNFSNNNNTNAIDRDKNNNNVVLKTNKFSILHINAEFDNKPAENHRNVFSRVFGGLKSYLDNWRKGLHRVFHGDHDEIPVKDPKYHWHELHRSHDYFDPDDNDNDSSEEHYSHY